MKKNIWKRLISVLCVLSLVVSVYAPGMITQAETTETETTDTTETSEQITLDDMGLEFIRLSFEDFGITQETKVTSFSEATSKFVCTSSESLTNKWDKTITYGKVKIGASTSNEIHLVNNRWDHRNSGLFLRGTTGGNLSYYFLNGSTVAASGTLSSSVVEQSLTETWIDLAISIEMLVKNSSTGSIRVGFFINGELYNNEFITMTNINTDYLGSRAMIIKGSDTNGVSVMPGTLCGEPEYLTLSDLNIPDNDNATGTISGTYKEALFNKKIGMIINAGDGDYICFMPHASTHYGGLQIKWDEKYNYWVFSPASKNNYYPKFSTMNVDAFDNHILLEMYANAVDYDYDGVEDDLVVAFWINGILWEKGIFQLTEGTYSAGEVTNWPDLLTNNTRISIHNSGAAMSLMSVPDVQPECDIIDITQADFATSGTQWADKRADSTGEIGTVRSELTSGLLGTKLNVDVMFPESGDAKFLYGATADNDGLSIYADGENLVLYDNVYANAVVATLTPEIAKATLVGERINLQISYESTFTIAATGVSFDAVLGIYINGNLYNDAFITLPNVGTELGKGIATKGTETDVVTIWMPLESKEVNPSFTSITVKDFTGLSDNYKSTSSTGSTYKNGTLVDTVFTMRAKLKVGNYFHYAGVGAWYGLRFHADSQNTLSLKFVYSGGSKNLCDFTSAKAGTDLIENDILIQISAQAADFDRDGTEDDLIVGVFFDGKLYNNRYLFIQEDGVNIQTDWVGKWFAIQSSDGGKIEYYSEDDWYQALFLETAPADYNVVDGTHTNAVTGNLDNAYNDNLTMNGKSLKANVTFTDGGKVQFAGKDGNGGFSIYRNGNALYLASVEEGILAETQLAIEKVYLTSLDTMDMTLEVSVEYIERDGSGTNDDVKLGIWLQETLCNDTYFYVNNYAQNLGSELQVSGVTILSEERNIPTRYDYTQYTFDDYVGLDYMTYKQDVTGTITSMVSDEIIYTDKVSLSEGSSVTISGYTLTVSEQNLCVAAGDKVLATKTVGEDAAFALVTKRVDADEDGVRDDVQLAVYVDGELYNNRYFYLMDYQTAMDNVCTVTANDGSVALKELYEKPAMPVCLDTETEGYVLPTDKASIVVNREETTAGTALDKAGDYRITYTTDDGAETTHVVACYYAGDANADNKVSVKDLLAFKKAEKGLVSLTKAGMHGANLNNDDTLTKEDGDYLRKLLVGTMTATAIEEENATTTFGVISDVHLDHTNDQREDNLRKALECYRANGAEVIIVNGDISDYGTTKSYNDFVSIYEEVYPDANYAPKMILTADNHEYYDAWSNSSSFDTTQTRFSESLVTPLNTPERVTVSESGLNSCAVVDDYYFIGISSDEPKATDASAYSDETITFLQEKLAQAKAADTTKPIFVAVHQPPTGTVANESNSIDQLITLGVFDEYPQAVIFSSHTHTSIKTEKSIWKSAEKGYTVFNTGSLYYVGSEGTGYTDKAIGDHTIYDFGEGLLVNVRGSVVTVDRLDFFNNEEIKESWVLNDPENVTDYTDARETTAVAPVFDTEISARQMTATSVQLTFASAYHEDFVHHYKVKVTNVSDGTTVTRVFRNDFFLGLTRMADTQQLIVDGLTAGTEYKFEVTAVESFGKESESPIDTTYTLN